MASLALIGCEDHPARIKPETFQKQQIASKFIKSEEGFLWHAKKEGDGVWRIGYSTPSHPGAHTSKMLAEIAFHNYNQKNVFRYIPENTSTIHYILMASLIYGSGIGGLQKFMIDGKIDCNLILKYDSIKNSEEKLTNRRRREYNLCIKD